MNINNDLTSNKAMGKKFYLNTNDNYYEYIIIDGIKLKLNHNLSGVFYYCKHHNCVFRYNVNYMIIKNRDTNRISIYKIMLSNRFNDESRRKRTIYKEDYYFNKK
jgi:hypothetical protein